MGTVETRSKTPAEGSSPSPEKARSRTSEQEAGNLKEALKGGEDNSEVSVRGSRENGIGFSINGNEGLVDDADDGVVEVVKSRLVETKVSVQRDFGSRDIEFSFRNDCHGLADSEMNGVSSLLKMRESGRSVIFPYGGGSHSPGKVGSFHGSVKKPGSADGSSEGGSVRIGEEDGKNSMKSWGEEDDEDSGGKVMIIDVPIAETSENESKGGEIEDMGEEGYGFSVGDFVWGKIRSHPWWPGQIYDPSDASESAVKLKLKQKNRFLVAYFGDGTFAWCHPSQLKPFEKNFEHMVKQSSSRTFFNAVQEAVNEIGNLLDLKTTKLAPPLARNSGIKEGVLVPEIGIEKLSTVLIDPLEILSRVKQIAETITIASVLELKILKARLSAFYLFRGGYKLASYQPPQPISGLEDNEVDEAEHLGNNKLAVETLVQGPFEDDFSSPLSPRFNETGHSPGNPANKSSHRRKQKSISEIMGEDNDVHAINKNGDISMEGANVGKSTVSSGRKKRKRGDSAEHDGCVAMEDTDTGTMSRSEEKKDHMDKANNSSGSNRESDQSRGEAKEQIEKGSLSRERKKSKYLSPPFTTPSSGQKKKDIDIESFTGSSEPRLSKRMSKVASQLMESPPLLRCTTEAFLQNLSDKPVEERELAERPNSQTPDDENKRIDTMKIQVPAGEVRSELRSLALNPHICGDIDSLEKIVGFVLVFRSSLYREGSYYKVYNKRQPGRKRKKPESDLGTSTKDQNHTDHTSPKSNHDSEQKKKRRNKEPGPDAPEPRQAVDAEKGKKGTDKSAPAAALFVTFGPGSTLPSKTDIVTLYSKFGSLDEAETDMFYNNHTARVSFLRSSDAEKAFNHSKNVNPFGPNSVSFRIQYLSSESKPGELGQKSRSKASPAKKEHKTLAKPSSSESLGSETSKLNFIKQKLEALTSMLEALDVKLPETKTKLETEIKGLLKDVNKMVESSSS
ncbi:hypothetical protein L6164_005114 [Bauhinia variegata]|uniref:Uncharacterized protein n=1 Tax=Bauhinia variegata TaxID=167791 RepID=A0ACB9PPF6_BAUVA|nr:hypothetical protein L6164_005114 [Bauhinia variegata]